VVTFTFTFIKDRYVKDQGHISTEEKEKNYENRFCFQIEIKSQTSLILSSATQSTIVYCDGSVQNCIKNVPSCTSVIQTVTERSGRTETAENLGVYRDIICAST
jgi:hypothetical protein